MDNIPTSRKATIEIPVKVNQSQIKNFNDQLSKIKSNSGDLSQNLKKLNGQLDALDKRTGNYSKGYTNSLTKMSKADRDALKSSKQYADETVKSQSRVSQSLKATERANDSLAKRHTSNVNQQVSNNNKLIKSHANVKSKLDNLSASGDKLIRTGQSMSLASLGIGAAFLKGAKDATALQHQYKVITNLATYGGEKQSEAIHNVSKMQKQGEQYSLKYGVAQQKLSAGYEELIRRGYSTNQALAAQKTFLQGALASGDDYTDVVHNATAAIESFGLKTNNTAKMAENSKKVVNQMAYAADLTATDFNGMGEAMKYVGASAHSANQSVSGTASAIGVLSNAGIDASQAGTGLRQVLDRLVAPPTKGRAVNALKQIGLTSQDFRDSKGNLLSLQGIFDKLNSHMKGMNGTNRGAIFNALFGQTGQNAATILSEHSKYLGQLNDQVARSQKMDHGKGYIAELSAKNLNTAQSQINKFKAAMSGLNISFANEILPNITGLIKGLDGLIVKLADTPSWFKKIVAYGGVFVAGIAPVTLVFGSIAKAISTVGKSLGWVKSQFSSKVSGNLGNSMLEQSTKMQAASDIANGSGGGTGSIGTRMERYHGAGKVGKLDRFLSRFGGTAKTGTRFGKVGEVGRLAEDAGKVGKLGKFAKFAGAGIGGLDVLTSATDLIGINKHNAGSKIGSASGSLIGTGIGGFIGSFAGPIGTAVGAGIGGAAAGWLGKHGGSAIQKVFSAKAPEQVSKNNYFDNPIKGIQNKLGKANANYNLYSNLDNSQFGKSQKSKLLGENKQLYQSLKKEVDSYSRFNQSKSKQDATILSEYGIKSKNSILNNDKKFYKNSIKNANSAIDQLIKAESKGGKTRQSAINKANHSIARLMSKGNDQQKIILGKLGMTTKKMSDRQASDVIKQSYRAYKGTASNANKMYNSAKKAADKKYSKVVDAANRERFVTGSITDKQYKKIVNNAQKQKNETISNAQKQKNKSIENAQKQHDRVVAIAKKQTKDHLASVNDETGGMLNAWQKAAKWLEGIWSGMAGWFSKNVGQKFKWIDKLTGASNSKLKNTGNINTTTGKRQMTAAEYRKTLGKVGGYAKGGPISRSQIALVNEQGPESAYNAHKGTFRMLGHGKPMLTKLFAGEHVLTAKQTKSLFSNAYAQGTGFKGFKGINSTVHVKMDGHGMRNVLLTTRKYVRQITNYIGRAYKSINSNSIKSLKQLSSQSNGIWKHLNKQTSSELENMSKRSDKISDSLTKSVVSAAKDLDKQLNPIWKDIVSDFKNAFAKLSPYAHAGMNGAVGQLNGGIKGINATLSQFGGNNSVLKPIHYAKGSNGVITKNHLAVVNDATYGPRQEAIVRNNQLLYPNGKNAMVALQKGDQVLNGRQTEMVSQMSKIAHYAKGSGVSDNKLRDIANRNAKNPNEAWTSDFANKINAKGSTLQRGITEDSKNGAKSTGIPWYKAMWNLISSLASGGSGSKSAFLNYAMKKFTGKPYVLGADGPSAYDCSGMVSSALAHFGINIGRTTTAMQASSGLERIGKNIHKTQAGDIALFGHGTGAAGHVGIVNNPRAGTIFNETPPRARTTPLSYITALPLDAFYRVKGLKDTVKKAGSSTLDNLVKKQLGKKAMSWISNNLAPAVDGADTTGPKPTGDHSHWLQQAGIPKSWWNTVNEIIFKESSWNPKATNGDAYGLPQAKPGSKMASAGKDWRTNPITQLRWMKSYIKGRYGSIENAISFRRAHNWYANGGWADKPSIFGEVKGQPEVVINPKRSSADNLIGEAIHARARADKSSPFANLIKSKKLAASRENLKAKLKSMMTGTKKMVMPKIEIHNSFTLNGNIDKETSEDFSKRVAKEVRKEINQIVINSSNKMGIDLD